MPGPAIAESPYRLDVASVRGGEPRMQSLAYVFDVLAVLTIVHVARDDALRIVGFRPASDRKGALTMAGSKKTSMATNELRAAAARGKSKTDAAKVRAGAPYVWDGKNEDERPFQAAEHLPPP